MSRFAALRDDDGDNGSDESDAFEKLTPQYSLQEILNLYKSSVNDPPPPELSKYSSIFVQEPQAPECSNFHPPKSEINSTIYLNPGKQPNRRNTRITNQRGRGKSNNSLEKSTDSQVHSDNEPEEDLSQLWYYKDPLDCVVGPYTSHQMQEWMEKRYIDQTLLIRNAASEGRFQPISVIFQDTSKAFAELNNQKPSSQNPDSPQEKRITTLISFSMDDDNEDWEHDDQKI
ncbi:GRB10 interacting GYF protein 1 [Tritrichomonas musculus]|uniref:GRB10 interacting GYF protein 1 n=1 Tax=Tritrichomonas musculus TaxID=1915356 RepID=A0ABR2JK25_9EUKA